MNLWKVILATLVIFAAGVITGGLLVNYTEGPREHRRSHPAEVRPADSRPAEPVASTNASPTAPRDPNNTNKLTLPFANPPHKNMSREFLERLDRELKFNPEQRKQVAKILDEGQKRTKEVWEKVAPEMREVMKTSNEKIHEVLTPEQNKRFEELMKFRQPKPPKDKEAKEKEKEKEGTPPTATPTNPPVEKH